MNAFVWTLGGRTGIREPGTPKGPCVSVTLACPGIGAVLPTVSPRSSAVRHVPADRVVDPSRAHNMSIHMAVAEDGVWDVPGFRDSRASDAYGTWVKTL